MIRGAVLTLGVIVMLGGASAARADDLRLFGWPSLASGPPASTGIFPRAPENWSDLPFQLHLSEQTGYNSNIANTPSLTGQNAINFGRPIGALQSISTYGVSFKNQIGGQHLFADASWGMYRYLNNGAFNRAHSSVDIGDNFNLGSKCSGVLKASEASAPSLPGQQLGINVINTITTLSFTENAKCMVSGEYAGILNSGTSKVQNSAALDKQNDYQSVFVAAGMSYSVSDTNTLQILATITGTDFTSRNAVSNSAGLTNKLTTDQIMATYTRNFGHNIAITAQFGLIGIRDSYFSFGIPRTILPQYAFTAQWTVTPKITLNAAASRLASAPTSVVSNLQITESASTGLTYRFAPKVTLAANLLTSYATRAVTATQLGVLTNPYTANQRTLGANANVNYAISPFLAANLSYQYTKSVQSSLTTTDNLILLALSFNPY
jgi:hypothetical protein